MKFVKGEKNEVCECGECHGGSTMRVLSWWQASPATQHRAACLELWVSELCVHSQRGTGCNTSPAGPKSEAGLSPAGLEEASGERCRDLKLSSPMPTIPHPAISQKQTIWPGHLKDGPSCKRRAWDPKSKGQHSDSHIQLHRKGKRPQSWDPLTALSFTPMSENHRKYREEQEMRCFSLTKTIDLRQTVEAVVRKSEPETPSEEACGTRCGVLMDRTQENTRHGLSSTRRNWLRI